MMLIQRKILPRDFDWWQGITLDSNIYWQEATKLWLVLNKQPKTRSEITYVKLGLNGDKSDSFFGGGGEGAFIGVNKEVAIH